MANPKKKTLGIDEVLPPFKYCGHKIRAIVLDVDDTLVATQPVFEVCCETVAADHGYDPARIQEYMREIKIGRKKIIMPLETMMETLYPEINSEESARWVTVYQKIAATHLYDPIADAHDFLEQCFPRVHLGFCSNEQTTIAVHRLQSAKLNPNRYFPASTRRGLEWRQGKTVGIKKPDRAALDYFVHHFNIEPHELLMVGDMKTDYDVAQNAGTHGAIILSNDFSREMMEEITGNPHHVFESLTDLFRHLSV